MSTVIELARPEIRNLRPYRAASYEDGLLRLNANEAPWRPVGDTSTDGLHHYPEVRPATLTNALARHYDLPAGQVLVTRGSSEAIDLLIRCFCRPNRDAIIICPPTFGMYAVYAQVQGADIIEVPLRADSGYELDVAGIAAVASERTKLLFICSPNNPTGNRIATAQIEAACDALGGNGLIVVDAAYAEFADTDPTRALLEQHDNIVVLRTLSKALGLAGIRCGVALAAPAVVDLLGCILPPYAYPTPCAEAALAGLADGPELATRIDSLRTERSRVAGSLQALPGVTEVLPSEANFLLVRVTDPAGFVDAAKSGGVLIRDFSWDPAIPGCLRITIGSRAQNDQLLEALAQRD